MIYHSQRLPRPHAAAAAKLMPMALPAHRDFPILARRIRGKPFTYLDSAATTQKPRVVLDAVTRFYETSNANVHRGIYAVAEEATEAYEQAHKAVARFIRAPGIENIAFTKNTTESLNLLSYSLRARLRQGDEIVLTRLEHHSNLVPWQQAAAATGAALRFIELGKDGSLDMRSMEQTITDRTKVVSVTAASNVLGTLVDIAAVAARAHEVGAVCVADAAQLVPHAPVDVRALGCDFLAFSGHKMYAPGGIGVLYGAAEAFESLPPFLTGGEMIREVRYDRAAWNSLPWKFEAGTPPVADAVGLAAAIGYLDALGMDAVAKHEQAVTKRCYETLAAIAGVTIYGPPPAQRGSVVAFTVQGVHPHDLATILDQEGVAIRAGHHCAMPLHEHLGIAATARASFGVHTQRADIDLLAAGIRKAQALFS